jgi:hypothetical protein
LCKKLLGVKINFHKSEIYYFGKAKEDEHLYREIFGCESGVFPFQYLGVPIHYRKLTNSEWNLVEVPFKERWVLGTNVTLIWR